MTDVEDVAVSFVSLLFNFGMKYMYFLINIKTGHTLLVKMAAYCANRFIVIVPLYD